MGWTQLIIKTIKNIWIKYRLLRIITIIYTIIWYYLKIIWLNNLIKIIININR